jgi:hypothetical protein
MMGRNAALIEVMRNVEEVFLSRNLRDIYHLRDLRVCVRIMLRTFYKNVETDLGLLMTGSNEGEV